MTPRIDGVVDDPLIVIARQVGALGAALDDLRGTALARFGSGGAVELGYAEATANQTGIGTSPTNLANLSTTVTVADHPLLIQGFVQSFTKDTATGWVQLQLYDATAAAVIATGIVTNIAAGEQAQLAVWARVAPAAGSRTYRLRALCNANTCALNASATAPAFIHVIEVT